MPVSDPDRRFQRDEELLEQLYRNYGKGRAPGSAWRHWFYFLVKRNLWIGVVEGSRPSNASRTLSVLRSGWYCFPRCSGSPRWR